MRAFARGVFDFGRVIAAELIERGSRRLVSLIMQTPEIREEPPDPRSESIIEVTDAEMLGLQQQREQMRSRPRQSRPTEDSPPLVKPLEGSLQWRREQARLR